MISLIWLCADCAGFVEARDEVELAVAKQEHLDSVHGRALEQQEDQDSEDTVLVLKYALWAVVALLELLSLRWPALRVVSPVFALWAFLLTSQSAS